MWGGDRTHCVVRIMPAMESSSCHPNKCKPISPDGLREQISVGGKPLILDCRSQSDFRSLHIEDAISVAPLTAGLIWRRLRKGNLSIASVIQSTEGKEKFNLRCHSHTIVLYDDQPTDGGKLAPMVTLLQKKLEDEGYQARYLSGGFSLFRKMFPEHCVDHSESCENSLNHTIYELSRVNLSEPPPDPVHGHRHLKDFSSSGDVNTPTDHHHPIEVIPNLYLGNAKSSSNLNTLNELGIRCILNVTSNVPNVFQDDPSFKYMQIPIDDHWSQNLAAFFSETITFIDEGRQRECGVLVHCLAGISRSVTVVVAYLMQKMRISLNDAYDMVKKCKPDISPNFNFMGQLLDFEHTLNCGAKKGEDEDDVNDDAGADIGLSSKYHGFFTTPTKSTPMFERDRVYQSV